MCMWQVRRVRMGRVTPWDLSVMRQINRKHLQQHQVSQQSQLLDKDWILPLDVKKIKYIVYISCLGSLMII